MASTSSNQQQQQSATTQLVTTVPQYRIINQSGKTLLNHNNATTFTTTPTALVTSQISQPKSTLIPTSIQLSSGCEIYVIKEIGEPPKQLLSESAQPTIKTLGNNNTTIKLEPPISPTPAPAAGTLQILRSTSNTTSAATSSKQQQSIASNLCQNSIVMNNTNISSSPQQEESVKRSLILEAYKKRDDKRRATHNEVERRRRDKINSWIFKLKEMLPSDMNNVLNAGGNSGIQNKDIISNTNNNAATAPTSRLLIQQQGCSTQRTPPSDSKSQILIKACEYIKSMQEEIQR